MLDLRAKSDTGYRLGSLRLGLGAEFRPIEIELDLSGRCEESGLGSGRWTWVSRLRCEGQMQSAAKPGPLAELSDSCLCQVYNPAVQGIEVGRRQS